MSIESSETLARVASDGRGQRTTYEEIRVGEDLGTLDWTVTPDQIAAISESDDDYHEWYAINSPFGGIIAPVLLGYPPVRLLFSRHYNVRGLFYEIQANNLNPIRPGKRMILSGKLADKWIKRDREFVAYEAVCVDEDGLDIFRTRRSHVLDFIPRTAPRLGAGIDSGAAIPVDQPPASAAAPAAPPTTSELAAQLRSATSADGDGTPAPLVSSATPVGWRLPHVSRQMSLQQFRERHKVLYGENVWPEQNLHSDEASARREGLKAPVASAPTIFALVTRMMMTTFARGWIVGGNYSLKMIAPVYPHNFVTAKGVIRERADEGDRTRFTCEVWVETEEGQKVVAGRASGILPQSANR
jgi:acyl dehydratase